MDLFDVSLEQSVPNWFSSSLLLLCSLLTGTLSVLVEKKKLVFGRFWAGLCFFFLYLSVDENVSIHERTIQPLREMFHTSGYFHYAWVLLGILIVALMMIIYAKFVFKLPKKVRNLVILAGLVYVLGALGMEMLAGQYLLFYGEKTPGMTFMTHIEELMEMCGLVIFIDAALLFIQSIHGRSALQINITD